MLQENRLILGLPARHMQAIALLSALLLLPAFILNGGGSDLISQALLLKVFSHQLWHGDLYPRWLADMYMGNGSPVFFYYPPLTFYITSLFTFLSPLAPFEYYPMVVSALFGVFVSGITFYCWMKEETGNKQAALMGSLLYMAAPAHVAHSFYFTMLFSTVWVYAWLPLLLWSGKRMVVPGESRDVALFALALCLLIMTNTPETLIWGPIAVAYAAFHMRRDAFFAQGGRIASGVLLGFGLSAIFLLPAISYLHYTIVKRHWTEPSGDYNNFFLRFDTIGTLDGVYYYVWIVMLALLATYWLKTPRKSQEFLFFTCLCGAGLFMILPISKFIWDSMNIMKMLQYPLRFFIVPSLALTCLACTSWPRLPRLAYGLIVLYVGVTFTTAVWPREPAADFAEPYQLNIEQHANYMTSYDLIERYYTPEGLADVKAHDHPIEIISGDAVTEVKQWFPRHIVFSYHTKEQTILRIHQFYFPGFKAFSGDTSVRIGREGKTGQIMLDIPEGSGEIHLDLTALPAEQNGENLSAASFIVFLLLLLLWKPRKQLLAPSPLD
jgi:hypothetical protein